MKKLNFWRIACLFIAVSCFVVTCKKDDPAGAEQTALPVTNVTLTPGFQQLTLAWTNPENVSYVEITYTDVEDKKQTVRFDTKGAAQSTYTFAANDLRTFDVTLVVVTADGKRSEAVTVSGTAKITSKYDAILETVNVVAYGDFGVLVTWENPAQTVAKVVITYNGQTTECNAATETEKAFSGFSAGEVAFTVEIVNGDEKSSTTKTVVVLPMDLQSRVDALLASVTLTIGEPVDYQSYGVLVTWDANIEVEAEIALSYGENGSETFNTASDALGQLTLEDGVYDITVTVTNAGQTTASAVIPLSVGTRPYNGPHNLSLSQSLELPLIDFDEGGEGYAYHDADDQDPNFAAARNETAVDIEAGNMNIGKTEPGEWLVYTINVEQAGVYQADLLFSSHFGDVANIEIGKNNPGYIHLDVNGVNATGPVAVPDGYAWHNYRWMPVRKLNLNAGKNKIRLTFDLGNINMKTLRLSAAPAEPTIIASWTFENENDLYQPAVGNAPLKIGKYLSPELSEIPNSDSPLTSIAGPAGNDKAVLLPEAYFFFLDNSHGIAANGGGARMNEYTLVLDFMIPNLTGWVGILQTDATNTDNGLPWPYSDAEIFVNNTSHGMGYLNTTDYMQSNDAVFAGTWYRYVISAACGGKWFTQYLNGRMFNAGPANPATYQNVVDLGTLDGWLSFDPAGVILFGDNDGESTDIHVAKVTVYNGALSRDAVEALGGLTTPEP
ncbi:MAG: hypothetical protein LBR08_11765 [Bacteroidales bacterium]|jgi:hypothetical protein|nr:hypothetical protein [Bacteroidales bacterium]